MKASLPNFQSQVFKVMLEKRCDDCPFPEIKERFPNGCPGEVKLPKSFKKLWHDFPQEYCKWLRLREDYKPVNKVNCIGVGIYSIYLNGVDLVSLGRRWIPHIENS